mmetsp:Transcript_9985/g.28365  ORF Transcript_9985/g.28365 Transcript_9985/m.28365 type:complete len:108 (+) Transcript_9985:1543-1866(+)
MIACLSGHLFVVNADFDKILHEEGIAFCFLCHVTTTPTTTTAAHPRPSFKHHRPSHSQVEKPEFLLGTKEGTRNVRNAARGDASATTRSWHYIFTKIHHMTTINSTC